MQPLKIDQRPKIPFYHNLLQLSGVKVTVFYESLCPDSIRFIENQLLPNYDSLKEFITLDFVPFGKASVGIIRNLNVFENEKKNL